MPSTTHMCFYSKKSRKRKKQSAAQQGLQTAELATYNIYSQQCGLQTAGVGQHEAS